MKAFDGLVGVGAIGILIGCSNEDGQITDADKPTNTVVQSDSAPENADTTNAPASEETTMDNAYVLDHKADRITGETEDLSKYKGQVVMIVNVASKCGFTKQYEPLEQLYSDRKGDGFVVLGFPANNFGQQEPGTNAEVAEFCRSTYGVEFPMFAKIDVIGDDVHPLYKELASQPEPIGGDPEWNFTKFLVNRKGEVVYRFDTRTSPDDPKVIAAIDELLAQDAG